MIARQTSIIDSLIIAEQLPQAFRQTIDRVCKPLARRIAARYRSSETCLTVGLCGAQGSGKSTIARVLAALLQADGLNVATLSLDDFYLTHAERCALAAKVHPLLKTRGVPGTHDVTVAMDVLQSLRSGAPAALPCFDKARDDRCDRSQWITSSASVQVILLEGWCVGARPQGASELLAPVNALERDEDASGVWRRYVNDSLAGDYQRLFESIDWLVLLAAPDFDVVCDWRAGQESKLHRRLLREGGDTSRLMKEQALQRFVAHYERLTRHILKEMPVRADALVRMNHVRQAPGVVFSE